MLKFFDIDAFENRDRVWSLYIEYSKKKIFQ